MQKPTRNKTQSQQKAANKARKSFKLLAEKSKTLQRIEASQLEFDKCFFMPGIKDKHCWYYELPRTTQRVYLCLLDMQRRYPWLSIAHWKLAFFIGVHTRTVQKAITYLRQIGVVKSYERYYRANHYRIYDLKCYLTDKINIAYLKSMIIINESKAALINIKDFIYIKSNLLGKKTLDFGYIHNPKAEQKESKLKKLLLSASRLLDGSKETEINQQEKQEKLTRIHRGSDITRCDPGNKASLLRCDRG